MPMGSTIINIVKLQMLKERYLFIEHKEPVKQLRMKQNYFLGCNKKSQSVS